MRYIELTQGQRATVDDDDWEWLSKWKWRAWWRSDIRGFYAVRTEHADGKAKMVLMHRIVMGAYPGQKTDHWDHDTLNNQRPNLRLCTNAENARNQRKHLDGRSTFKGATWIAYRQRWQAQIGVSGRKFFLGYFINERDAALAYDRKARELFGEFALTNFSEA